MRRWDVGGHDNVHFVGVGLVTEPNRSCTRVEDVDKTAFCDCNNISAAALIFAARNNFDNAISIITEKLSLNFPDTWQEGDLKIFEMCFFAQGVLVVTVFLMVVLQYSIQCTEINPVL